MARALIVGGGCRGRRLAQELLAQGHAVRITTRSPDGRAAIQAIGAECWVGTPDRLATLRGALENVTILCWLLGTARGRADDLAALHGPRLEYFVTQAIDTTVRGIVYEAGPPPPAHVGRAGGRGGAATGERAAGDAPDGAHVAELLRGGREIVRALAARNAIPVAFLTADPADADAWLADARGAVAGLLGG